MNGGNLPSKKSLVLIIGENLILLDEISPNEESLEVSHMPVSSQFVGESTGWSEIL